MGYVVEIRSLRCVREGKILLSRDVLQTPDLAKYVQDWGRTSDRAFITFDAQTPVGAAWYRLFNADNPGYGYVDDRTPELAIALLPRCRNKGLGKSLLIHLFAIHFPFIHPILIYIFYPFRYLILIFQFLKFL